MSTNSSELAIHIAPFVSAIGKGGVLVSRNHRQRGKDRDSAFFEHHFVFWGFGDIQTWIGCDPLKGEHAEVFDASSEFCKQFFEDMGNDSRTH